MSAIPMTPTGEKLLQKELNRLKTKERPLVIQAIAQAREYGDLKENAEYQAAREQQGFIEGRIQEIESKLNQCQVIDVASMANRGRIVFGATVTLFNVDTEKTMTYQIVGDDEADIQEGKISYLAPIARAMIGKMQGDNFELDTPNGHTDLYDIIKVEYLE